MARALHTDQYSLTMAQFYWQEEMNDKVSFELFVRSLPKPRGYLIVAGLGTALWHLRQYRFTQEEIDFLRVQTVDSPPSKLYEKAFLDFLRDLDFECDIWALPEGTPIGAGIPILRVTGPRIQATLIESLLLSIINHQTMIASKVARIVSAAQGRGVWDFSLRRLHGPEASLGVARAAYIAGARGTATVEAGRILKVPLTGTMAHAQIMAFGEEREQEVFERTLQMYPYSHALLVDTYDTERGVQKAVQASRKVNIPLRAIRIDSDLDETIPIAKAILLGANLSDGEFADTQILVSDDLDEYAIAGLLRLQVDGYGVGTMLGTSADAPHLGGVYKLVEQHERVPTYTMKLTPGKQTDPGAHQVWRFYKNGQIERDLIALAGERYATPMLANGMTCTTLLQSVMAGGRIIRPQPTLQESREYCADEKSRMPLVLHDLEDPGEWRIERSGPLWQIRADLGDREAQQIVWSDQQDKEKLS